jgi:lipopolysaccharide/colanic/teichoic acid biosynthesis glycosyltransferase
MITGIVVLLYKILTMLGRYLTSKGEQLINKIGITNMSIKDKQMLKQKNDLIQMNKHTEIAPSKNSTKDVVAYAHPIVKAGKRGCDLLLATTGIIVLLPVIPFIAIAIKLDSKGPIFYRQRRLGQFQHGQYTDFEIIKFRSMDIDAESDGVARLATQGDPRITKVGKFLRKTRLDEVPQLINVLRGDMAFIGPRPERPELTESIEEEIPFFTERTYGVLPGLTGLAQINQSYLGSVNNINEKLAYDHAYSLVLSKPFTWLITDIKILFRTILTVVKCNG